MVLNNFKGFTTRGWSGWIFLSLILILFRVVLISPEQAEKWQVHFLVPVIERDKKHFLSVVVLLEEVLQ